MSNSSSNTKFWIHIRHYNNSIEYFNYVTPTFRFVLIDAFNNRQTIEAFRSLYDGDAFYPRRFFIFCPTRIRDISPRAESDREASLRLWKSERFRKSDGFNRRIRFGEFFSFT